MPTGYTADIARGITFKQYALGCARAFGALIEMRDEPADAPIPEKFKPSQYHVDAIKEAKERLKWLRKLKPKQAAMEAEKEFIATQKHLRKGAAEKTALKAKYEAMLKEVDAYKSPSKDHDNFKKFMREQIEESMKFDCSDYYERELEKLQCPSGGGWLAVELAKCERDIAYHAEENEKEEQRTNSRNEWIAKLRKSLP